MHWWVTWITLVSPNVVSGIRLTLMNGKGFLIIIYCDQSNLNNFIFASIADNITATTTPDAVVHSLIAI